MAERSKKKPRRALGGLTSFKDGMEVWIRLKERMTYKRVLLLLVLVIGLYTDANHSAVLDWLNNLLALLAG